LLQFDQSINDEEFDDVEELNADVEVLQFPENTDIDNKNIEDVSSAPISTKKNDELLALIGGEVEIVQVYKIRAHGQCEF
jgi:hypothetical protein